MSKHSKIFFNVEVNPKTNEASGLGTPEASLLSQAMLNDHEVYMLLKSAVEFVEDHIENQIRNN